MEKVQSDRIRSDAYFPKWKPALKPARTIMASSISSMLFSLVIWQWSDSDITVVTKANKAAYAEKSCGICSIVKFKKTCFTQRTKN